MQQPPSQQPPSTDARGAGSELTSDAKHLGASAVNRIHSEVDARKGNAVTQAQSVSTAIERAADGLDESAPAWLKSAFEQGAQKIQQFADTIESKDSRQLISEAETFARNNPGTFLAACAAAGFAAARVFKAGGQQEASGQAQWDEDVRVDPAPGDSAMFRASSAEPSVGASPRGEFA